MKSSTPLNGKSTGRTYTDYMPPPEISEKTVTWKISGLVKVAGAVITSCLVAGAYIANDKTYKDKTNERLDRLECGQNMLIDVLVFKKQPVRPDCK